jgi:urease accessory protein UreF
MRENERGKIMSALEDEIIVKFRLLDKTAQQRVLQQLTEQPDPKFDRALQAEVRETQGADVCVDVVSLLREVQEDR